MHSTIVLYYPKEVGTDEWTSAKMVTLRHITKDLWNNRALLQFSTRSQKQIYVWESEKTAHGTNADGRSVYELERHKQGRRGKKSTQPRFIRACEGAEVMVTVNIDTDIDLANGTRGIIEKIVLAEDEPPVGTDQVVKLTKMPLYILVRLEKTRSVQLEGLEPNIIPILPYEMKHKISYKRGGSDINETITERQYPFVLGYAFTDYRAQGQTLGRVIVDLATPATGKAPTQFNFYVSLSRSSGREHLRLLRYFDESIFGDPLPATLMDEDDRLEEMDQRTYTSWKKVDCQRFVPDQT